MATGQCVSVLASIAFPFKMKHKSRTTRSRGRSLTVDGDESLLLTETQANGKLLTKVVKSFGQILQHVLACCSSCVIFITDHGFGAFLEAGRVAKHNLI